MSEAGISRLGVQQQSVSRADLKNVLFFPSYFCFLLCSLFPFLHDFTPVSSLDIWLIHLIWGYRYGFTDVGRIAICPFPSLISGSKGRAFVLLCMRFLCFQFCIRAVARCGFIQPMWWTRDLSSPVLDFRLRKCVPPFSFFVSVYFTIPSLESGFI